ncbi:MAG: preprotein translocase subunit SecE [Pontimonas sp.]
MTNNAQDGAGKDAVDKVNRGGNSGRGSWGRLTLFLRQVLDELSKVVTPTRRELVNYTLVVLVFVLIMMAFVSVVDLLFGWGVSWVFGDGRSLFG